jgi:hypothetical protein
LARSAFIVCVPEAEPGSAHCGNATTLRQKSACRRTSPCSCLAPCPAQPFIDLTRHLAQRFPDFQPYGGAHGGVVPHLTVADGHAEHAAAVQAELQTMLARRDALRSRCNAVTLIENSSGRWQQMMSFDLTGGASSAG